jgi:hypothetical protein
MRRYESLSRQARTPDAATSRRQEPPEPLAHYQCAFPLVRPLASTI